MNFSFLHKKLLEKTAQYSFFNFYSGYDVSFFLSSLVNNLTSTTTSSIYFLNFSPSFIDSLSVYNIIPIKNNPKQFSPHSLISISERVLLLDLLSHKTTNETISALIIGDQTIIEEDSKIIFILKMLQKTKINVFLISNNSIVFSQNSYCILTQIPISKNDLKIEFIPRFHKIVDKIIEYIFMYKQISVEEFNFKSKNEKCSLKMKNLLLKLVNNIKEEISNLTIVKENKLIVIQYLSNLLSCGLINQKIFYNNSFFSNFFGQNFYKAQTLYSDLITVKNLLYQNENFDLATMLGNFHLIQKKAQITHNDYCSDYSIWNYEDSETQNVLFELNDILKTNIYTIESVENNEENEIIDNFVEISKNLPNVNLFKDILTKNKCSINYQHFDELYPKHYKLIQVLDSVKDKENILIITDSQYVTDSIMEIMVSKYVVKDDYKSFFDNKMRNFLLRKNEFVKRRNILTNIKSNPQTNFYIENLLLQYTCYKLCMFSNITKENIYEKILSEYQNDELLPSEIEISEEIYAKFDKTVFNEETIISPSYVSIFTLQKTKEESLISLYNKLMSFDYTQIILFNPATYIIRYLETFISNNELSSIKKIVLINQINSFSFESEISFLKSEMFSFKKLFSNYHSYQTVNDSSMPMEIVNESQTSSNQNILIDFREMGAKSPFYLYSMGFNIITSSLEVGDYITSNTVCIERKSITTGDLFESLRSSRLTNQIVKMEKYYNTIIILCEFEDYNDVDKLYNSNLFKSKFLYDKFLDLKKISNKIHYLWSISPRMTAKLLIEIKHKYKNDYLDVNKCIGINKTNKGTSKRKEKSNSIDNKTQKSITSFFEEEEIIEEKEENNLDKYEKNQEEIDNSHRMKINIEKFIRSIDGINTNNYPLVLKNFKNIKEFIFCPREKLYDIFGRINGNKIFSFFLFKVNA